jgi:hypothetical protein
VETAEYLSKMTGEATIQMDSEHHSRDPSAGPHARQQLGAGLSQSETSRRQAQRWARKAYSELARAFLHFGMGCAPTPTDGWWKIGMEVVPDQTLTALIGWHLVVKRKRMRSLHAQLETTDRAQAWTPIESKTFPHDTPSGSVAEWAAQAIRTRLMDYVASLRHAIEVAFQLNGNDAAVRDAGLDMVEDRNGVDDDIGSIFFVDLVSIPDHIFVIAVTQHEVVLESLTEHRYEGISRRQIVAGTTATQIATWACDQIGSHRRK